MQSIWCDEAGQTGNKLDDGKQPHFVYSAVALDRDEAKEIVEKATRDYRLDGELKVTKKRKYPNGQKALTWILETCAPKARILVHDKKYALACKYFEQMVEPIIAERSSVFYAIGFHKFITHLLFLSLRTQQEGAEQLLVKFQQLFMAERKVEALSDYLAQLAPAKSKQAPLRNLASFLVGNHAAIADDVETLATMPLGRWVLDQTLSSLYSLLIEWGQQFDVLDVYYDDARPLKENADTIDLMTGMSRDAVDPIWGKPTSFHAQSIQAAPSAATPGIQIAEVFASAPAYALKEPGEELSKAWMAITEPCLGEANICPDPDWLAPGPQWRYCNLILEEMVRRTQAGQDLFSNLDVVVKERYQSELIEAIKKRSRRR